MGFDSTDDCCYNPRRPWGEQCRGGDSCCTEDKQCFEGKADLVVVCDDLVVMVWLDFSGGNVWGQDLTLDISQEKVTVTMTRIAVGTCGECFLLTRSSFASHVTRTSSGVEPTTALVPALMTLTIAAWDPGSADDIRLWHGVTPLIIGLETYFLYFFVKISCIRNTYYVCHITSDGHYPSWDEHLRVIYILIVCTLKVRKL